MTSFAQLLGEFDPHAPFVSPANWLQGRTVFGGLSAALSLQAVLRERPMDFPPFKSAQVSFIASVTQLDAQDVDPSVALIALADSLPPAVMTCFTEPAAISSASWMIDLPQPAVVGEWFLINSFSRQALEGYSLEDTEIWDESACRVLWVRQDVAIFT